MSYKAQLPQVIEASTCDTADMLLHWQIAVEDDDKIAHAGGWFKWQYRRADERELCPGSPASALYPTRWAESC